ncbi:MAG: glycosyltransferase [Candidatus Brocadiaceae bacterium]|nr:glycosyltransferase [Candidatus Brocadiaceae bacterium]
MKILYVYSDWKWTGPSQPIVELCNFMADRAEVSLLTSAAKNPDRGLVQHIHPHKVQVHQGLSKSGAISSFVINKTLSKQMIQQFKPDIVHVFRERDLAALPGNSVYFTKIYTDFKVLQPTFMKKLLWKQADVVTVFGKKLQKNLSDTFKNIVYIPPWLDFQKIPIHCQNIRHEFGLTEEDFIVGLVMRVQPHRRFDLVVETAKLIKKSGKRIKFLLMGRGAQIQELAVEPTRKNNLTDVIVFGGYKKLDYWNAVNCFDILFYTCAGSDGTVRALRQCQAMGKPVICLSTDFTREIVHENRNGFLVQENPKSIMEKIDTLYTNRDMLPNFSKNSLEQGRHYDLQKVGQGILELYKSQNNIIPET